MKQHFETIKVLVEKFIAESAKQLPANTTAGNSNLTMNIPNKMVRELIDYWRESRQVSLKEDKNDKENRLKRMLAAVEWLYQSDNKKFAQRKTSVCEYPMTRAEGVQTFILLLYRYYYGNLQNLLFHDDPERRTGYYQGREKTSNSKTIRKTDLEFQAITLALQAIGFRALVTRTSLRQSVINNTTMKTSTRETPRSMEEIAEAALRPSLSIHTTIVAHH